MSDGSVFFGRERRRVFLLSFSFVFFFFVQERHRHSIARQRPQDLESRIGVEERIFADGGSTSTPGRRKTRERKVTVSTASARVEVPPLLPLKAAASRGKASGGEDDARQKKVRGVFIRK